MPEFADGGYVDGPGASTRDSVLIRLQGCTVHGKPHPRACDADCDGEWVIPASAISDEVRKQLNALNRSRMRSA